MSSDYYGSQAGELADQGEVAQAFEAWLNEYTRHELPDGHDQLLAAFIAGQQSAAPGRQEAENLRHALKEAGKEMDRRYEMGEDAERARIWRGIGERKEVLAYPVSGHLVDAVRWELLLEAVRPEIRERDALETIIPEVNPVMPGDRFVIMPKRRRW